MNGEDGNDKGLEPAEDGAEVAEDFDATVVMSEDSVEIRPEDSAEINVEKLVADVEALKRDETAKKQLEARKRLDEIAAEGDDEFGSTYNFDLDDDLLK
ncbi:MAG: hypothetical protein ACR2QT_14435 [Woeseiaceae bacterium]